ncbi:MAG: inorganic phosphate transporter [Chloroflexi bacterium]|nr:inorganic phosphate transporter [Chloroflexota bacterium]
MARHLQRPGRGHGPGGGRGQRAGGHRPQARVRGRAGRGATLPSNIETSLGFLVIVIAVAVIFDFANGFNDAANAIATVVSTRVLTPVVAVLMAASLNFAGAFSGTAVAKVVGAGVVASDAITLTTVAAGVAAAAVWVILATRVGLPISGSHSLVAGVAGAGVATGGFDALVSSGVTKILLGLALAPVVGFVGGYVLMLGLYWLFRRTSPAAVSGLFGRLQMVSAAAMAFSHGSNDAQKTMGVIALALATHYKWAQAGIPFHIPVWVILLSGTVMALGTYAGGWNVVRTLGVRIVQMRPVNGFAAESAAASVIESASRLGFPLSTTHVITSTIMGQGSTRRLSAVRWGVARGIVIAWIVTFPFCALLGAGLFKLLDILI